MKNTTSGSVEQYLPVEYLLWISNEKQYEINRPTVIITVISIILGLIGNILVIYVFGFCFKRTTANIFVSCLALSDTFTCFFLCFETLDLRYPLYSGNYPEICKTVRFLEVFCHSCSSILLVCIAMDRFYKICKPFIYISLKKVKRVLAWLIISMLLLSWPVAFIHGPETVVTPYPQVNGKDCADDDNFKGSVYSGLYFFLLLIITLCCIFAVVILYCRIYWAIIKWKFSIVGENNNSGIWSTGGSSKLPIQRPNNTEKIPSESREIQRQSRFVVLGEKYESSKNSRISSAPESPKHSHTVTAQYAATFRNSTDKFSVAQSRRSSHLENMYLKDSTIKRRPSRFVVLGEKFESSENRQSYLVPESYEHSKNDYKLHDVAGEKESPSYVKLRRPSILEKINSSQETAIQRPRSRYSVFDEKYTPFEHHRYSEMPISKEFEMFEDPKRSTGRSSTLPIRVSSLMEKESLPESTIQRRRSRFVTLGSSDNLSKFPQIYLDPDSLRQSENLHNSIFTELPRCSKIVPSKELEDIVEPLHRVSQISFLGTINMENVTVRETTIQRRRSRFDVLNENNESTDHSQSHSDQESRENSQSFNTKLSNETPELEKPSDRYPNTPRIIIQEPGVREDGNREETVVQRRIPTIDVDQPAEEPISSTVRLRYSQIVTSDEYKGPEDLKRSIERSRISLRTSINMDSLPVQESTNHPSGFGGNNNMSDNLNTYMVQESQVDSSISKSSKDGMTDDSDKNSDVQFRRPTKKEKTLNEETPFQRRQSRFVVLGENYKPPQTAESYLVPPISVHPDIASSKRYLMKDNLKRSLSLIEPVKYVQPISHRLRPKSVSFHLPVKNDNLKTEPTNSDENSKLKVEETSVIKGSENGHSKKKQKSSNLPPGKAKARLSSTTVMFSLTALFYVLSYIPTLIVETINAVQPLNLKSMSIITRQLIVMANSAYFFNLSFNPIIYGVFNKHFRKEMGFLLKGKLK